MKYVGTVAGGLIGGIPGAIIGHKKAADKFRRPTVPPPQSGGSTSAYGTVIPGSGA